MNGNSWSRGLRVSLIALTALLLIWGAVVLSGARASIPLANDKGNSNPSSTPTNSNCQTWQTSPSDYSNNRWFADGIAEIREAKTAKQSRNAANVWLDKVKTDPVLLAGAARYIADKKVSKADLSVDGCATTEAVDLVTEIAIVLGQSRITPDTAPADGYNSGVSKGEVVGSADSGVYGNRTAIKVVLPNGKVIWIMARCGNPVTKGTPPVPHGPTDNPPPPKKCPPGQHGTPPICKDGAEKGPAHNAQFPEQQKPNKLPADPKYYQPTKPSDPPATYVPPAAPAPKPAPRPTPPPSAEPSAPTPSDPGTGCIPSPGKDTC